MRRVFFAGLTLVVASTLALGIGANAAVFSLIKGTLLAVPPFPDAGRVLRISSVVERTGQILGSSMPDVRDWRAQTTAFVDLAAYFTIPTQMAGERLAESVDVTWVSPGFFEVIGLSPLYGRTPREDEFARGADVFKVVLAHGFWRRAFGGDPAVVGRSIRLYRQSFTVVGVMPTAVDYPGGTDLWAPMQGLFGALNSDPRSDFRQRRWHRVVGRVRPALDVATANAELDTIGRRLAAEYPGTNRDIRVRAVTLHEAEVGDLRPYFLLLLGAVGFVLLICCANVANLQLARGHSRLRELAVRSAMGATRPRLLRELFIEQVVVAVLGGLLGLAGAHWLLAILMRLVPVDLPSWTRVTLDAGVLCFTLVLAVLAGLLAGIPPAVQASRTDLAAILKAGIAPVRPGSLRTRRPDALARSALVAAQNALALILVVCAGLMLRSLLVLQHHDPGFTPENVLAGWVVRDPDRFEPRETPEQRESAYRRRMAVYQTFYQGVIERLQHTRGVAGAAGASRLPYQGDDRLESSVTLRGDESRTEERRISAMRVDVSPGYFSALRIPLLEGRTFTNADSTDTPWVVVVSARAADTLWPGRDPIGQELKWGPLEGSTPWATVVGVVGDVRYGPMEQNDGVEVYYAYTQVLPEGLFFLVRTTGDAAAFGPTLREAVGAVDRNIAVANLQTLDAMMVESIWQPRLWGWLVGAFACLALTLAAVGVYGVMAFAVSQRTCELGIRLALGARPADLVRRVLLDGLIVTGSGAVIGLGGAALLSRLLTSVLVGVEPLDRVTFAGAAAIISTVALAACYVPARRAASVDPLVALRGGER